MQEKINFYCYIDKLVCNQAAIFNPSVEIKVANKQCLMRSSSSTFPTFFFKKKFKCIISNRDGFNNTSFTFKIYENSTELMKKSLGFSFLKGNDICQSVEIKNEDCDRITLYFRAINDTINKEPRWFSSINAEIVNATVEGVRSADSFLLDDIHFSSSGDITENEYISESDSNFNINLNQTQVQIQKMQMPIFNEKPPIQRIAKSLPDNCPSPSKKVPLPLPPTQIQPQLPATPQIPRRIRKSSSTSFGEEEDKNEEEDNLDDDMPPLNDNHSITNMELFVKVKYDLLFRTQNDKIGYEVGLKFMQESSDYFTTDQKYAVQLIENYIKSPKFNSVIIGIRFFNSLLITHQVVCPNKRLGVQIKRIIKILIEKIYKSQSKDMISFVSSALKSDPSSRSFSNNSSKLLKMRRYFIGENAQFLFTKINEFLDCEICNLMITKMEFNTYSIVLAASDNLPQFETLSGLTFPRLRQAFKSVIMRNDVISSPLIVKKQMPLLSSTFVFYLLSIVKPDKTIPQQLPFEKLQKFALTAEVEFRNPIENCLLKPGRLRLPKICSETPTE